MALTLGLDLGTNSLGWAVVDEEKILNTGVRIFPEGINPKTMGQGDKEESRNAERREFRQRRRQVFRVRLRRAKLLRALIDQKMCPLTCDDVDQWTGWNQTAKKSGRRFPDTPVMRKWLRLNPYALRAKALTEPLTLEELGRVFYHLIQRRGFVSGRREKEEGKIFSGKDHIKGIDSTKESISEHQTLGAYLNTIHPKENHPYSELPERVRARYTTREMYVDEFDRIWEAQRRHLPLDSVVFDPNIRYLKGKPTDKRVQKSLTYLRKRWGDDKVVVEETDKGLKVAVNREIPLKEYFGGVIWRDEESGKTRHRSRDSLLFFQRPLRSQKGLLAKCRFEAAKTPVPLSHPKFEEFRAWQFINNIEADGQTLSLSQRRKVMELINARQTAFDFKEIPKKLNMISSRFNYGDKEKVAGNPTHKFLSSLFPKDIWKEKRLAIWHAFHFYEDSEMLIEKLAKDFGLTPEKYEKAKTVKLKEGYASVSLKAIRNINPFLREGFRYSDATLLGGVRNLLGGKEWEERKEELRHRVIDAAKTSREKADTDSITEVKKLLCDPEFALGFSSVDDRRFRKLYHHSREVEEKELSERLSSVENLRNPIVQQSLSEVARLVNLLLKRYGRFDQIRVEMGRDLKQTKDQRNKAKKVIEENRKDNDEARRRLAEFGLKPSRENIHRYLLYKEIERSNGTVVCPYTNKAIGIADLLGGENAFQIEHIIPYSVSLDDSFANKTLCDSDFNGQKGELTPWQFYEKNNDSDLWGGARNWEEVEERAYKLLPYRKAKRFVSREAPEGGKFIERQLNDTRYITKKAREILTEICPDVRVMPGQLTAELRRLWGINNILAKPRDITGLLERGGQNDATDYWLVVEDDKPQRIIPKINERPEGDDDELILTINKRKGKEATPVIFSELLEEKEEGHYWAGVIVEKEAAFTPYFNVKPESAEGVVVVKGRIENGKFTSNRLNKDTIITDHENGAYWAALPVTQKKFFAPTKKKERPETKKGQIALYGEVEEGQFTSHIYRCACALDAEEGKQSLILNIDTTKVHMRKIRLPKPQHDERQIPLAGQVNAEGFFTPDDDPDFLIKTEEKEGKYWGLFTVKEVSGRLQKMENEAPKVVVKNREIIEEGSVWLDKYSKELRFEPKKNRDDHRHHALDALTIALTKERCFQEMSRYTSRRRRWRQKEEQEKPWFPPPWENFATDAKRAIEGLLVSYRNSPPATMKISKKIKKQGQTFISKGEAVRGALHKESMYGKRTPPQGTEGYHIRKNVSSLENNKHIGKVVDPVIREILERHLREKFNIDTSNPYKVPANAFFDQGKPQVFLPNKNGAPVPIKKVRIHEEMSNARQRKEEINQYVNPRKNYLGCLYRNSMGDLQELIVSLWEVAERRQNGEKPFALPFGAAVETIMRINDFYLLGLGDTEAETMIKEGDKRLSDHLYRVQKLSKGDYNFRHHLASTLDKPEEKFQVTSIKGWQQANPIAVIVSPLGEVTIKDRS